MGLMLTCTAVCASQWVDTSVSLTIGNAKIRLLIDADTLKFEGDIREFWYKMVSSQPWIMDGLKFTGATLHEQIECAQRHSRVLGGYSYDENNIGTAQKPSEWRDLAPDTTDDNMRDFLCSAPTQSVIPPSPSAFKWIETGNTTTEGETVFHFYVGQGSLRSAGPVRDI